MIGDKTYQGLLLEGTPTAFGAGGQSANRKKGSRKSSTSNMKITGGKLAEAFGSEAYLRIVPQANSTFNGQFTADFSSEMPLTNLRAKRKGVPATVPEPTVLVTLLTCGAGLHSLPLATADSPAQPGGPARLSPPAATPTVCLEPRFRSGGRVRGSVRAIRRSP